MEAVVAGETFVVTRNGEPVAELRPLSQNRRLEVNRSELLRVIAGSEPIDRSAFLADLDVVDQSL